MTIGKKNSTLRAATKLFSNDITTVGTINKSSKTARQKFAIFVEIEF
jgi:hypothetical protein